MGEKLTLYADFNNADATGRLRLNCKGTLDDLETLEKRLEEGLDVIVSDGELQAEATVVRSQEENIWVAVIDWNQVRTASVSRPK
jgi:hypothetical protein